MKKESPYARYYVQGHAAAIAGVAVEACPYRAAAEDRLEQLSRRMAWLEGHLDGLTRRAKVLETGRSMWGADEERPLVAPAAGRLVRSIIQRRYQRGAMLAAGGPERYVDRRLRQIAAEEQGAQCVTAPDSNT